MGSFGSRVSVVSGEIGGEDIAFRQVFEGRPGERAISVCRSRITEVSGHHGQAHSWGGKASWCGRQETTAKHKRKAAGEKKERMEEDFADVNG